MTSNHWAWPNLTKSNVNSEQLQQSRQKHWKCVSLCPSRAMMGRAGSMALQSSVALWGEWWQPACAAPSRSDLREGHSSLRRITPSHAALPSDWVNQRSRLQRRGTSLTQKTQRAQHQPAIPFRPAGHRTREAASALPAPLLTGWTGVVGTAC